jgi:hypothetical protein
MVVCTGLNEGTAADSEKLAHFLNVRRIVSDGPDRPFPLPHTAATWRLILPDARENTPSSRVGRESLRFHYLLGWSPRRVVASQGDTPRSTHQHRTLKPPSLRFGAIPLDYTNGTSSADSAVRAQARRTSFSWVRVLGQCMRPARCGKHWLMASCACLDWQIRALFEFSVRSS